MAQDKNKSKQVVVVDTEPALGLGTDIKPGWGNPKPEHIPAPTYWPVIMALGITFIALGVPTSLLVSAVGALLFVVALAGWIGDLLHESQH